MKHRSEAGFSYVDVMIAIVILSVGILALLSGIAGAVVQSKGQEIQLLAKQVASSTMESIMSLKETDPNRLGWIAMGNVNTNWDVATGTYRGVFVVGEQNVLEDAGPDQVIGTADDTGATIPGMTREIVITDQCDTDRPSPNCATPGTWPVRIRTVVVTVRYSVNGVRRQERLSTVLTDYAATE